MKTTLVYVHLPHDPEHVNLAARFLATYHANPPLYPHDTVIVCNGSPPTAFTRILFASLNPQFVVHDDSGWDIGAYIFAARMIQTESMFCCGGPCYFKREGWLRRIAEAWDKYGPGMYGSLATYLVRPHINTSGFAIPPQCLREYPGPMITREHRYEFEHGLGALWRRVLAKNMPALLVTWDGVWNWQHWRRPANCYQKGDQSNCLTFFRHSEVYDNADARQRQIMQAGADTLTSAQAQEKAFQTNFAVQR